MNRLALILAALLASLFMTTASAQTADQQSFDAVEAKLRGLDLSQVRSLKGSSMTRTDLRYARSTAVTRNLPVSLCPSEDGSSCSGNPFGWHHGYLVFVDADGNRKREPGETLLRRHDPFPQTLQLHSTKGRPAVRFRPDGAAWSTNTTFSICHGENPAFYRAVVLYGSGRARVDRQAPGNKAVTCS